MFRTRYDYFKYQIMLYNLFHISINFENYINKILAEKLDIFVIVYLDEILIYTNKIDNVNLVW